MKAGGFNESEQIVSLWSNWKCCVEPCVEGALLRSFILTKPEKGLVPKSLSQSS